MRMSVTIRWAVIALLLCCVHGQSSSETLNRSTTAIAQSAPKRQGFFDYALGKINPHDIDYGASLEAARVSSSARQRCGLCGSEKIVRMAPLIPGPWNPGPMPALAMTA